MDGIGFTDDEINQLNNKISQPKHTTTKTSGQRTERASQPSSKHVKVIGDINGASLTKPIDRAAKQREFKQKIAAESNTSRDKITAESKVENTSVRPSTPASGVEINKAEQSNVVTQERNGESRDDKVSLSQPDGGVDAIKKGEADSGSSGKLDVGENHPKSDQHVNTSPDKPLTKIEELQQEQAKLQKENRQKQKVLKDTITEKFTKTAEQAKLLKTLQEEVASIEKELSCDISILRDRIDYCNRRYFDARKRYESAEQEYVAAKLDLHNCQDLKEGLEEHLFTIIKLNETKKSEKLAELHNKLENMGLQ